MIIAITFPQFLFIAVVGIVALMGLGVMVIIRQHRNPSKDFLRRHGLK